ncbi:RDD family protein [Iamia sp. SCSIO 61187]|uniref:RDD family protein n=1 Tax=Iamia sp. SCSIO 61187 TaxID=2722752 RepID=UPI001C63676C|nr:RDD family protein [Iamia sp. SCSIO 61187]QYG92406.1 RDD family protein [Iamia sp. SCSIO 61187]
MEIEEWHPPSHQQMPEGPQSFPRTGVNSLATLGARGLARTIDTLVIGIPYFGIVFLVMLIANGGDSSEAEAVEVSTRGWVAVWGPLALTLLVYETVTVALWGQTLGKLIVGIRVARQANGRCPLWWEAALRIGLVAVILVIPHQLALAVAMGLFTTAGFDPMRRNLTDRAAGTVVVRAR